MGIKDWFVSKKVDESYKPTISFGKNITEQFKGEVELKEVKFPRELGEEHPFDFSQLEELYKKFGFFTAVIDKYVDFVWGPGFYVECGDDRAKEIIDDFMRDVNLDTLGRAWTKEGLMKGSGVLEIGGSVKKGIEGLKTLNANYIYVVRDKKGKVLGFNQYKGAFDKFDKVKVIPFTPQQIAHFAFNKVGDSAYGLGIGYPVLKLVDNLLQQQKDHHELMSRKANAPLHAQLGYISGDIKIIPKPADVAAFGKELETLDNKRNWATDPLVNFKVIDFGNIGEKFSAILEHDVNMLIYAFQIPGVLLGMANIPEGLARVQMDAFERRIQSIQAELEKIIEEQIFKRVLNANGFDVHVEFQWGRPSNQEKIDRLLRLKELMINPRLSDTLFNMMEQDIVKMLDYNEDEYEQDMMEEGEERKREEERPQPIVPGQNQTPPQRVLPKSEQPPQPKPQEMVKEFIRKKQNYEYEKVCPHCQESWDNINDIQEWLGFNYKEYLSQIHNAIVSHDFEQIKALTEAELTAGYLTDTQVEQLKKILDNGFKKGSSIVVMSKQLDKIGLKDLYRMTEDGDIKLGASGLPILAKAKEKRGIGIVRSEVTRMANLGAENFYKEKNVSKVRWIASYGERTCIDCETLNNQIFDIGNHPDIPLHPLCRCMIAPVEEVK